MFFFVFLTYPPTYWLKLSVNLGFGRTLVKGLVICFLSGWSGSTNQKQYNLGRFKVMATYLQQ
jgi:hypothetical protein